MRRWLKTTSPQSFSRPTPSVRIIVLGCLFFCISGFSSGSADLLSVDPPKKKLRALVTYNSTSYFMYKGKTMGFEYELLQRLADSLNMDLKVVVSDGVKELIPDLLAGKGDLIAHGLNITPERQAQVNFTDPIIMSRHVLVQRKPEGWEKMNAEQMTNELVRSYEPLLGDTITVVAGSSYEKRLKEYVENIGGGIHIQLLDPSYSKGELIEMVNDGLIRYTIAEEYIAGINASWMPDLDVSVALTEKEPIAWAVRPEDKTLLAQLNEAVRRSRTSTYYAVVYNKYFKDRKTFNARVKSPLYSLKNKQISVFDPIVKKESEKVGWDWRLVSAAIYQESRFNPQVKSWAGAQGLMQLMPNTAKSLGVKDPLDPQQNIMGGCKYLGRLYNRFESVKDPVQRMKFALASYNCGIGHVYDAQRLAASKGLDRTRWDGNVEQSILDLSDPEEYQKDFIRYGYVRGRQPYNYVRDIFDRYEHYSFFTEE